MTSIVQDAVTKTVTTAHVAKGRNKTQGADWRGPREIEMRLNWEGERRLRAEVRDQNLFITASGSFLGGVVQFHSVDMKACEESSYRREVIQ